MNNRAVPVHFVEEDHSRLAVSPCTVNDLAEDLASVKSVNFDHRAIWVRWDFVLAKGVSCAVLYCLHELVRRADGNVEVVDIAFNLLAVNELKDVWVVYIHDCHVGTVTLTTLRYES